MMSGAGRRILIIADIEGSSGCWSYRASSFKTGEWARACVEMSRDVNAVVRALFESGVESIRIKDFHRTGYNLLPELIDTRAVISHGYHTGPVPGIGDPGDAEAAMFLGMHAASGTAGFLAHTLTSRIEKLEINGEPLPEIKLFASSLAIRDIRPIFFSGCPVACQQAREASLTYPCIQSINLLVNPGLISQTGGQGFNRQRSRPSLITEPPPICLRVQ
jgi:D-amino peptidase